MMEGVAGMTDRHERDELSDLALGAGEALTVEDVQRLLRLSRNTVYKLARTGELPSYRVGRQIRFRYSDVMARADEAAEAGGEPGSPAVAVEIRTPSAGLGPKTAGSGAPAEQSALPLASPAGPGRCCGAAGSGAAPAVSDAGPAVYPDVLDELPSWMRGSLVIGGQDMACDVLANYLPGLGVKVLRAPANGYVSLARMYLGTVHAAVVSLWSGEEDRYNIPYVRAMLPGAPVAVLRLYRRRVGFTVARRGDFRPGRWSDLLEPGVRIANRERGAEARVLLDERMAYLEADPARIAGYDRVVESEFAQALMVARGMADVAVTSERPFRQMEGLDFLPMQQATVDLVVSRTAQTATLLRAVRSLLRTDAFRREFDPALYDTGSMGDVVYEA